MPRLLLFLLLSVALHASAVMLLRDVSPKSAAPLLAQGATVVAVQLTLLAPPLPRPATQKPAVPAPAMAKLPAQAIRPAPVISKVSKALPVTPRVCQTCLSAPAKPQLAAKTKSQSEPAMPVTARPTAAPVVAEVAPAVEVLSHQPVFAQQPQPPHYPPLARRRNQQGVVLLEVRLDAQGAQRELKLLRSSGVSSLDQAALDAVAAWRFRPETRNGQGVPSRVQIPVEFALLASR